VSATFAPSLAVAASPLYIVALSRQSCAEYLLISELVTFLLPSASSVATHPCRYRDIIRPRPTAHLMRFLLASSDGSNTATCTWGRLLVPLAHSGEPIRGRTARSGSPRLPAVPSPFSASYPVGNILASIFLPSCIRTRTRRVSGQKSPPRSPCRWRVGGRQDGNRSEIHFV
jgi:hypothetical protein